MTPDDLRDQIPRCMRADQHRLARRLRALADRPGEAAALAADIADSVARREARVAALPAIEYPPELPVAARREAIARAIAAHPVTVVCGETGSGKTTQLPKICLELGRGIAGWIGHTQPRRIAARSVAARIAEELGSEVGAAVGYKVRFGDHVASESYVKLMTDGILLAELRQDRFLDRYDTIIVDEAHERSLNIDFLLGYLKRLLPRRPDLKLIITSATIDPERFSRFFDDAPVVEVSGRGYPVELRYRPLAAEDEDARDRDLQQAIAEALDELAAEGPGDVLVFLPGERQIRETAEALRKHGGRDVEILPLYGRLSPAEQGRIFQPHARRRVVLATNVAETSLTVPGIVHVIDTGTARVSRYSWRSKIQRLPIEPISRASADQRKGRCGRTAPGVCVRLYSQQDYEDRPAFTDPEILRTNLAAVVLQMAQLRLGEVTEFPFIDPPDARLVRDAYALLHELGAVDGQRRLTEVGRRLARLPLDPRLGRMLLAAVDEDALAELLVVVAGLAVQDPRLRPHDQRQAADARHARFADPRSDFLALLELWRYFQERARHLSSSKLRRLCQEEFLSYVRLREWQDVHRQLRAQLHDMGLHENREDADYARVHRAVLAGLLGQVGCKDERQEYQGVRGRRFALFPGSGLFGKGPKWVMAAELVETTRVYARTAARVDPQWIETLAAHLTRHHYHEPRFNPRSARVDAGDRVTLHGLVVNPRRRVDYCRVAPVEARAVFITEALVQGRYRGDAPFLRHNRRLVAELEDIEAKTRRRDVLVDEQTVYALYDARVPAGICSGAAFEKWRREAEREDPRRLFFSREELLAGEGGVAPEDAFPDALSLDGLSLPLRYRFEPGADEDGVTLRVPLPALNQVDAARCEWLVPGLLEEKLTAMVRALPKSLRRSFVPAPDFARACAAAMPFGQGRLGERLARELQRMTGVELPEGAWEACALAPHLRLRIEVVDADGAVLAAGRDLDTLRERLERRAAEVFADLPAHALERAGLRDFEPEELPETVQIESHGARLPGFPALVDEGDSVALRVLDAAGAAREAHERGVLRLLRLRLREPLKYLQRNLPQLQAMCLAYAAVGPCEALREDILEAALRQVFLAGREPPRSRAAFEAMVEAGRGDLVAHAGELCARLAPVLETYRRIRGSVTGSLPLSWIEPARDVLDQLGHLVYPGFVTATPPGRLQELPRYLEAIERRLARLDRDPEKDRRLRAEIEPIWLDCRQLLERAREAGAVPPALEEYRWLVEELRVSLFAQELGTPRPISVKRLDRYRRAL